MKKVLVYGYYNQGNIGDNLFTEAFTHLFPNCDFSFTEIITEKKLQDVEAVFFGGGSFLLDRPNIVLNSLSSLTDKKIFYIGIGVENYIDPFHYELMKQAKIIAIRSHDQFDRVKNINPNTLCIPDLVYSLKNKVSLSKKISQSVLVIPNVLVVPQINDPHWKHTAWSYFKSEFVQFLDWILDSGYHPHLFSMCRSLEVDDNWAASELVSSMISRNSNLILLDNPVTLSEVTFLFSRYELVITQRYHGSILSDMLEIPHITISHHDKFKSSFYGDLISYYNCSKQILINSFNKALEKTNPQFMSIKQDNFDALVKEVTNFL